jgi:hypothetical protein
VGVRQMLARASPDLVVDQIVVRTELNMRIVMPSVIKHTQKWSYLSMTRFETGSWPYLSMIRFETGSGGNPNFHGFSWGARSVVLEYDSFRNWVMAVLEYDSFRNWFWWKSEFSRIFVGARSRLGCLDVSRRNRLWVGMRQFPFV